MTIEEKKILEIIRERVDGVDTKVTAIETCLKGYGNGKDGLVSIVNCNSKRLNSIYKKIYFIAGLAAAGGSGVGIAIARALLGS